MGVASETIPSLLDALKWPPVLADGGEATHDAKRPRVARVGSEEWKVLQKDELDALRDACAEGDARVATAQRMVEDARLAADPGSVAHANSLLQLALEYRDAAREAYYAQEDVVYPPPFAADFAADIIDASARIEKMKDRFHFRPEGLAFVARRAAQDRLKTAARASKAELADLERAVAVAHAREKELLPNRLMDRLRAEADAERARFAVLAVAPPLPVAAPASDSRPLSLTLTLEEIDHMYNCRKRLRFWVKAAKAGQTGPDGDHERRASLKRKLSELPGGTFTVSDAAMLDQYPWQ
ncbi:hypothetical protein JL721_3891 [Aureococcus anophagefferens]|nr:hypothetical protein JL721_3891 [Aureococcus anophagefferens]